MRALKEDVSDFAGENENGKWLGTPEERFPIYPERTEDGWLSRAQRKLHKKFHVTAYDGPIFWEAYVKAKSKDDVQQFFINWRILKEIKVVEEK